MYVAKDMNYLCLIHGAHLLETHLLESVSQFVSLNVETAFVLNQMYVSAIVDMKKTTRLSIPFVSLYAFTLVCMANAPRLAFVRAIVDIH